MQELNSALGGGTFAEFVERYAKLIFAVFIIAVLAGFGYVGLQFLQRRQERAASEAFFPPEERFTKIKTGFDQAKMNKLMPGLTTKDPKTADAKPATGNLDQDYGSVITDLDKVAHERAGTSAGAQAAIMLAETYLNYKQPDKAADIARLPAEQMGSSNTLSQLARVLWGTALADKGDCQAAVKVWQPILDSKRDKFLVPDVSLRSGTCYEQLNQPDKAAEMYRRVTSEGAESVAGQTAKGLLRALEVKTKGAKGGPA